MDIDAGSLMQVGSIKAGASYDSNGAIWMGKDATLTITTTGDYTLGGLGLDENLAVIDFGASLQSIGDMTLDIGGELIVSRESAISLDSSANGLYNDLLDRQLTIHSVGDAEFYGLLQAIGEGSDITLSSESAIIIDNYLYADNRITLHGGSDGDGMGIFITPIAVDGNNQVVSGGRVEVGSGDITITSVGNLFISGNISKKVDGLSTTDNLNLSSHANMTTSGIIEANDSVSMQSVGDTVILSGKVATTAVDGKIEMESEQAIQIGNIALLSTQKLLHLKADDILNYGILQTTRSDSQVLLTGGNSVKVEGGINSQNDVELYAGVDLALSLQELQDTLVSTTALYAGTVQLARQGSISAQNNTIIASGGDVIVDSGIDFDETKEVIVPIIMNDPQTIKVITGYIDNAIGTINVPKIYWETTSLTEQIGTELVVVGNEYYQFDVTLSQTGYYSPSIGFREILIEGLDYSNDILGLPTDMEADEYKMFTQLNDAQKSVVLEATGFKKLYDFSYSAGGQSEKVILKKMLNGNPTSTLVDAPWKDNDIKIYNIAVEGWGDKYIAMPEGAHEDVLRVVSQGEPLYLTGDTTIDGNSDGTWVGATSNPTGENVGRYQDAFTLEFVQSGSAFDGTEETMQNTPTDWDVRVEDSQIDYDEVGATWDALYSEGSGTRIIELMGATQMESFNINAAPGWVGENTQIVSRDMSEFNADLDLFNVNAKTSLLDLLADSQTEFVYVGEAQGELGVEVGSFDIAYWTQDATIWADYAPNGAFTEVVFFIDNHDDSNYAHGYTVGTYHESSIVTSLWVDLDNNDYSSIKIVSYDPENPISVKIYNSDNFEGTDILEVTENVSDLKDVSMGSGNWDNKITSLEVIGAPGAGYVTLYVNKDYGGANETFLPLDPSGITGYVDKLTLAYSAPNSSYNFDEGNSTSSYNEIFIPNNMRVKIQDNDPANADLGLEATPWSQWIDTTNLNSGIVVTQTHGGYLINLNQDLQPYSDEGIKGGCRRPV